MDQVRQVMRYHHYAYRTEKTYSDWIRRYIKHFGAKFHPKDMGKTEVEAFLSHLAVKENVSASTQRQALNALIFLYRHVLDKPIDEKVDHIRAKRHKRPPVVMSQSEVKSVLANLSGIHLLMAQMMHGSGLRLMECIRMRVQHIDFERNLIYARAAKGGKDRTTVLPSHCKDELNSQVQKVKQLHDADLAAGYGEVYLPQALGKKYSQAAKEFRWQCKYPCRSGTHGACRR